MVNSASLPVEYGNPRRRVIGRFVIYGILGVFALIYLAPLFVMIATSFKSSEEIRTGTIFALPRLLQPQNWAEAWAETCISVNCGGMQPYFASTLIVVIPAVFISTALGAMNGFALTKYRFPGAHLVFALMLFGCFIPYQAILLPLAQTLGALGLASTYAGLVLVYVVYGIGFTTLFFRNYYLSVPQEIVRAAMIDGAGFFTVFRRVILPISGPILVVTVIWQFTQIWNDFLFAATLTSGDKQTVMVALNNLVKTSTATKRYEIDMAAAIIAGAPTLLVYFLAGRYFVRGLTTGAVKG